MDNGHRHPARAAACLVASQVPAIPITHKQRFAEWFGQSKAIKPGGTPAVLYRGEHGEQAEDEHLQSRLNSLSFTDSWDAASIYAISPNNSQLDSIAQAPRVTLVYLKIENPIIENHNDPFIDLSDLADKLGSKEAERIALKFDTDIQYTGNWAENYTREHDSVAQLLNERPDELRNLYFSAYRMLDDPIEVERLMDAGYDGAIHVGNGETVANLEYRVFDAHQVRSAISDRGFIWWRT